MHHALVEDGILLQQDGSLLAGWTYRGPDMMSSPPAEMDALSARLNSVLKLGSGWMLQCDAIRSEAPGYPKAGAFPDPVTRIIDDERRQQFMAEEAHYESEYFLTLTYLPPVEMEHKVQGFMFEGRKSGSDCSASQILERFRSQIERFENVFGTLFKTELWPALRSPTILVACMFTTAYCGMSAAASPVTITRSHYRKFPYS
jgi:type IV secretion system protein VirB4